MSRGVYLSGTLGGLFGAAAGALLTADPIPEPCFRDALDARLKVWTFEWDEIVQEHHPDVEPVYDQTIPVGAYEGQPIPTYCYAQETSSGRVIYYQRPYGADEEFPHWHPHPKMAIWRGGDDDQ